MFFIINMIVNSFKSYTPNFEAKRVGSANVLEKNANGEYKSTKVSIAELDVQDDNDMETLKNIASDWAEEYKTYNQGYFYSDRIYNIAKREREYLQTYDSSDFHLYVMTKQKSKFKKLDPEKILAQVDIYNEYGVEDILVEYIQVRPKYQYNGTADRDIKEVGKVFLNKITADIAGKEGMLQADSVSKGFYEALKLKKDEDGFFHVP